MLAPVGAKTKKKIEKKERNFWLLIYKLVYLKLSVSNRFTLRGTIIFCRQAKLLKVVWSVKQNTADKIQNFPPTLIQSTYQDVYNQ